jgi:hypothetical protein
MLVFGGENRDTGDVSFNDLWSYEATSNSWVQLSPSGAPPPSRLSHTAVWDAESRRMVVYGGERDESLYGDVWSYEGTSNSWMPHTPSGTPPAPRSRHTAVWDAAGAACWSSAD